MNVKSLLVAIVVLCLIGCVNEKHPEASMGTVNQYDKINLSSEDEKRVERFLHPLPHEFRLDSEAYSFHPGDCSLQIVSGLSVLEKEFVAEFKKRWRKRFGTELTECGDHKGGLNLILLKNNDDLPSDVKNRFASDLKYLKSRPNPEQAYLIDCDKKSDGGLDVYLAANDSSGFCYSMATFEQLLNGLASKDRVIVPAAKIIDWPDMKERGPVRLRFGSLTKENGLLARYSNMKLNLLYYWLKLKMTPDLKFQFDQAYLKESERVRPYNIQFIPVLSHFNYLFVKNYTLENCPEVASKGAPEEDLMAAGNIEPGFLKGRTFCYSNPKTQEIIDGMFLAMSEISNRLHVSLSEGHTACKCAKCGGDKRQQFTNEVKYVIRAYNKVRKVKPNWKIDLWFSQGSYPHNYALLDVIPKDVGVTIYAGSGPNLTYKVRYGEYFLTPQTEELVARGYSAGATPMLGPTSGWHNSLTPNYMPQFVKLRMLEMKTRGISRAMPWIAWGLRQELNFEAFAEFAWNVDGRSALEFTTAYATRKGWQEPEKAARIIQMIEYPTRAIMSGSRSMIPYGLERMISRILGTKPIKSSYFEILNGFEYGNQEELIRTLKVCDQALELARESNNRELVTNCLLLRRWIAIFERYAVIVNCEDPNEKLKAKEEILALAEGLPELHKNWFDQFPKPHRVYQELIRKNISGIMKEFDRLKK